MTLKVLCCVGSLLVAVGDGGVLEFEWRGVLDAVACRGAGGNAAGSVGGGFNVLRVALPRPAGLVRLPFRSVVLRP